MEKTLAINGGSPALPTPIYYRWPIINKASETAVIEQLHRGLSVYDKSGVIGDFEDRFASIHSRNYGLVTSSGSAALHSAFYALGISPGDEVICPTYTFFATAMPLFQLGALPVLADCTEYGGLKPSEIERLLTRKTKAVVVTHMWGLPCDMKEIKSICSRNKLFLIEDCSHANGASYHKKLVGTFGDIAIWSFSTGKLLSAGEGGILLTDDEEIYDKAQLLGHFNKRAMQEISPSKPYYKYAVTGLGLKYRAHPLGIAFALSQLPRIQEWISGKQVNARHIREILARTPKLHPLYPEFTDRTSSYYAFVILVNKKTAGFTREQLYDAICAEGFRDIDIPRSTSPLHNFAAFQTPSSPVINYINNGIRGPYPIADKIASQAIKISVPVETEKKSRGTKFIDSFEKVWFKVVQNL
jgi:dTDP-4-amino-4,6-dideoxygalactose transaminase